jgi:hypothetical protein
MFVHIYIYRLHIAPLRDELGKVNLIVSVQYEVLCCINMYVYTFIHMLDMKHLIVK